MIEFYCSLSQSTRIRASILAQYRLICLPVLFLLVLQTAAATTYYVDAVTGADSNSGTSTAAPWKTIKKVNSRTYGSGDEVLLPCLRGEATPPSLPTSIWCDTAGALHAHR